MDQNSDFQKLLHRVRAGDQTAFAEMLDRFGPAIRAAVRRRLPDRLRQEFDSLDFVQEVWASFCAISSEQMTFLQPDALAAFLARVAKNKVVDVVRQRFGTMAHDITKVQPISEEANEFLVATDPSPSQWVIADEKRAALKRKLDLGQQALLERLEEGYTLNEIAELLGVSLSTVNRLVRRLKDLCDES